MKTNFKARMKTKFKTIMKTKAPIKVPTNAKTSVSDNPGSQIRIGNQTSFTAPPTLPFDYAIKNGFDAFEWFPDKKSSSVGWDLDDMDAEMRSYIKKTALDNNVSLSVHAPWWANPLAAESSEVVLACFKFAEDINAALVNIHLYTENGLGGYVKSILPFIKRAEELNIKLAIENTPLTGPDDFNKLFAIIQQLNNAGIEHVGMCFDIGHANLCSATHNDFIGFFDQLSTAVPLIHMHFHENYGDYDSHLPLYTGPSGNDDTGIQMIINRLKKRLFSGSIILEQWPEPSTLLCRARDGLRRIID